MRTVSPARSDSRGTASSPRRRRASGPTEKATGDSAPCSTNATNPSLTPTSVPSTVTGTATTAAPACGAKTVMPVAEASLQRTMSADAKSAVRTMAASVRAEPRSRVDQDGSERCRYITNPFHNQADCPRPPIATCGAFARNSTVTPGPGRRAGDRPDDAGDRDETRPPGAYPLEERIGSGGSDPSSGGWVAFRVRRGPPCLERMYYNRASPSRHFRTHFLNCPSSVPDASEA